MPLKGRSGLLRNLGGGLNRRSGREDEREDEASRRHEWGEAAPRAARTGAKGRGDGCCGWSFVCYIVGSILIS